MISFLFFQFCKRQLEDGAEDDILPSTRVKVAMTSYPFLPLQLYGFPGLSYSCYGFRPPEAHRNGSIDTLRMKAREHEAAVEMQYRLK